MSDAPAGVAEMRRVAAPGGGIAAAVWDYAGEMTLLRTFWDAATALDPRAADADEGRAMGWCAPGPLRSLWERAGLEHVQVAPVVVAAAYDDLDDLWSGLEGGVGPAGAHVHQPRTGRPGGAARPRCTGGWGWARRRSGCRRGPGWSAAGCRDEGVQGSRPMAELHFFTGTMDSGKSTLALQTNHNHAQRGRVGRIFTAHDRAGEATLSSRLGLTHEAIEVTEGFDFWRYVVTHLTQGGRIDYLVCDEAQFYSRDQIDQLAKIVDELQLDVFCFGILTDFRSSLFPGSARLVELADRMNVLQVEALCWCGKRATHNARTEDGVMVVEGEVIVVGDVEDEDAAGGTHRAEPAHVAYEVLCRQHHRRRLTADRARAVSLSPDPLPFG